MGRPSILNFKFQKFRDGKDIQSARVFAGSVKHWLAHDYMQISYKCVTHGHVNVYFIKKQRYWRRGAATIARLNGTFRLRSPIQRLAVASKTGPLRSKREPVPRARASGSRFDLSNVWTRLRSGLAPRQSRNYLSEPTRTLASPLEKVAAFPSWPLTKKFARDSGGFTVPSRPPPPPFRENTRAPITEIPSSYVYPSFTRRLIDAIYVNCIKAVILNARRDARTISSLQF